MSFSQKDFTKLDARRVIERIPEMRKGAVDVPNSIVGFCNKAGTQHGKVFGLLKTNEGIIQYSGAPDNIRRNVLDPSGDFGTKCQNLVLQKSAQGFQDLNSKALPFRQWDAPNEPVYRGKMATKSKCSLKKKKACKASPACTYRKSYKRKGTSKRVSATCYAKRPSKKMKKSSSKKKKAKKSSSKKRSLCNKKSKQQCDRSDNCLWVKGKSSGSKSRKGYCRRISKRATKKRSKCNVKKSVECKKSKKCSWRKRTMTKKGPRKGHCASRK